MQDWESDLAEAAQSEDSYELLAPDVLREVALSFPRRTGISSDGIHVRHLALLPGDALHALATIILVIEQLRLLPTQVQRLLIFLIPKATVGRRPIMLAPALYRWWARARRPLAEQWEADQDHPFSAASKGRTAIDPVYRRAVRAEAAAAEGRCVVTGLWDISKFYERIVHGLLVRRAARCGAPMRALTVCLGMYRAVRYLTISPYVSAPVRATISVAAGCGFATTWVKVYSLEPLVEALAEISICIPPSVSTNAEIYIDDLQWDVDAPTEEEAKPLSSRWRRSSATSSRSICRLTLRTTRPTSLRQPRGRVAVTGLPGRCAGVLGLLGGPPWWPPTTSASTTRLGAPVLIGWANRPRSSASVTAEAPGALPGRRCSGRTWPELPST